MLHMDSPGDFELIVMLAVLQLPGRAYGVALCNKIEERTEREVNYGTLYLTLDRLERKKWLRSVAGTATKQREGEPQRFYHFTTDGLKAFQSAGVQVQPLLDDDAWIESAG